MARQSTRAKGGKSGDSLSEEIQATRLAWNDGMEAVSASLKTLTENLRQLAVGMFNSPLGKRAQRHPATSLTVASIATLTLLRLLRR
ncbi:MAG: hypothetical protein P4L92_23185 [Rudaea sp.]|nr:hypothetical protein [Rudaea sp.]